MHSSVGRPAEAAGTQGPSAALPQCTTAARHPVNEPVNPVRAAGAKWSTSHTAAAPFSSPESASAASAPPPTANPKAPQRQAGSPFKRHS